ncbi:MAG: hypothetical protein M1825_001525 [Sarcosagium campestre]|nr:MAG: hypothetical protein M1825_001525 [Sarcosagium campestre]
MSVPLSAVAVRKQFGDTSSTNKRSRSLTSDDEQESESLTQSPKQSHDFDYLTAEAAIETEDLSTQGVSGHQTLGQLCSFQPSDGNVLQDDENILTLRLKAGETLCVLGQFDLRVKEGVIRLVGATLPQGSIHRVYSSVVHSIPLIQCVPSENPEREAVLELHACKSGLRLLKRISPMFDRIWNEKPSEESNATGLATKIQRSFAPLYTTEDDGIKRRIYLMDISPRWETILSRISSIRERTPVVLVCGPKATGKSTFVRYLANRLLTLHVRNGQSTEGRSHDGVAILDADPGQPEFSPPGQLSLVQLHTPVFGPPFSHPYVPQIWGNRLIRAHSIVASSPKDDPFHFRDCIYDLMKHHRKIPGSVPLLINYPGWILGSGLDVLLDLIRAASLTDIVYTSELGPVEIVQTLQEAAGPIPFHTLQSQPTANRARTAAELRAMQIQSYFHLNPSQNISLAWDATSLTHIKPWVVSYSGRRPGIFGVMVCGEHIPAAAHLVEILNGSLVSITAIEHEITNDDDDNHNDVKASNGLQVTRSPPYDLPLATLPHNAPFPPQTSRTLGLALIRGIDTQAKTLHLLTPILGSELRHLHHHNTKLVLVRGRLETPGWAYVEEMQRRARKEKKTPPKKNDTTGSRGDPATDSVVVETRALFDGVEMPWVVLPDADNTKINPGLPSGARTVQKRRRRDIRTK